MLFRLAHLLPGKRLPDDTVPLSHHPDNYDTVPRNREHQDAHAKLTGTSNPARHDVYDTFPRHGGRDTAPHSQHDTVPSSGSDDDDFADIPPLADPGGFSYDPALLELFGTNFQLRYLWGSAGCSMASTVRYDRYGKILRVLAEQWQK